MRTLRHAASLLTHADSVDALLPIAAAIGCAGPAHSLDASAMSALGIPPAFHDARIVAGRGALRALVMSAPPGVRVREGLARLAARLERRAPHLLVLLILRADDGADLGIAAWSSDGRAPRVAALLVDRRRVLDSDAETLRALAADAAEGDVLRHARWLDLLGREAISRRFYRALEGVVTSLADSLGAGARDADARREIALLHTSRLLFLSFLEAKGWLDGDRAFLSRRFNACMSRGGGFHQRVLLPLLFGTLNTPRAARSAAARAFGDVPFLNGGLFARRPVERQLRRARFSDEAMGRFFGELLSRYRFTAREDSTSWSEAAIDPEMLGKAFESLMAGAERRASGTFYTPHVLVHDVTRGALVEALTDDDTPRDLMAALLSDAPVDVEGSLPGSRTAALRARIASLRVLDPACGSGAFLVHALERLATLLTRLGDDRSASTLRREVLARSIFGVDVNPTAVWLCELRLWLSVVIEGPDDDPRHVPPLPNLDHHVRVGDSLAGGMFGAGRVRGSVRFARLRERYARATGARKRQLARALDRAERAQALDALAAMSERTAAARRSLIAAVRGRDLFGDRTLPTAAIRARLAELRDRARHERAQLRALRGGAALPFSFAAHFADAAADGGFDIIIGNPPWVRVHRIPRTERAALRRDFSVYRDAAWARGAAVAHAGAGFAAQVDLSAMFVELSVALLRAGGAAALLLPAKLWRSLAGGGVRALCLRHARVTALEDWSESRAVFDAAVYPSMLVLRRETSEPRAAARSRPCLAAAVHRRDLALRWDMRADALPLDASAGSPWLLVPPHVRHAFDLLSAAGQPLAESPLGRPLLGVKSGCNDAFTVDADPETVAAAAAHDSVPVRAGDRHGVIEAAVLRPLLRGEHVSPWRRARNHEFLLWTHAPDGLALGRLPPDAERWLRPWRRRLAARSDERGRGRWWSLFRTESASPRWTRVVWSDIGRTPRALVLDAGDPAVPLNSCYVLRCREHADALTLAAILNSPLAAAWLAILAEPARGGYRRYFGWTMSLLPIPEDWPRARELLAALARDACEGRTPRPRDLANATAEAYGIDLDHLAPLLAWSPALSSHAS